MSKINIVNEDCISGMQRYLSDKTVNVIVTSPPYNLGINYGKYDDHISRQNYLDWMRDVASELYRVLESKGSLFLNLGSKPTDPWVVWDVLDVFRSMFKLQNTFIWCKAISVDGVGSWGHYKPLNSKRFVNDCFEYVFHFTKDGDTPLDRLALGVPYADKSNIKRWDKADLRCRGNIWFVDAPKEDSDARWLAGLIDGEGCINILRVQRQNKHSTSVECGARLEVTNTNLDLIEEVARIGACGTLQIRHPKADRRQKQTLYAWRASTKDAVDVLCRVYPYLIAKRDQAKVVLTLEALKHKPGNKMGKQRNIGLPLDELELRDRLWETLKQLHRTNDKTVSDWVPEPQIERTDSSNVWFIPYETITTRKDRPHPATFPVQLVTNCLLLHGVEHIDVVLDPFMGLGSTARACRILDLSCVGFEIDPEYCKEATALLGGLR